MTKEPKLRKGSNLKLLPFLAF